MATIAVSGKGGAGKTTIAAAIIRNLVDNNCSPVLAVDADPNSCLGTVCGIKPDITIAEIRENTRTQNPANSGSDKIRTVEFEIQKAVVEAKGFDLLTMGRPEGPQCYCAVNNMLRTFLSRLASTYKYVVIDNEAGMEHLSRRTTDDVDLLCIVAEGTILGKLTAKRIINLTKNLPITVKKTGMVWNRSKAPQPLDGVETLTCVPYDDDVFGASVEGKTVFDLEHERPVLLAGQEIIKHVS